MTLCCWRHWMEQSYVRFWLPKAAVESRELRGAVQVDSAAGR